VGAVEIEIGHKGGLGMSIWHLSWIIPSAFFAGFCLATLFRSDLEKELSEWQERALSWLKILHRLYIVQEIPSPEDMSDLDDLLEIQKED